MTKVPEHLAQKINSIPMLPGIYKMLDPSGRIIYVGKSISLKNRVRSYFTDNPKWSKVEKMVSFIDDIEYIVTDTHLEAILLECKLIKKIKPMFNTQLKNDEKYVYLKVEDFNIYNPLSIVNSREYNCYGPFRRKFSLVELINSFKNIYPIIRSDENYNFEYNLIPISMDKDMFAVNKKSLEEVFSDNKKMILLIDRLEEKMKEAAAQLQFGTASTFRDMIYGLNYLKTGIYGYKTMFSKDIVLKIPITNGYKLFFVSKGEILLKSTFSALTEDVIQDFISTGKNLKPSVSKNLNEKSSMDFRDILYSEIKSLPDEMIIYL